ncbi:MAG: phage major capsid protein [Candidatus Heimdallarchaeaceae archaeon]
MDLKELKELFEKEFKELKEASAKEYENLKNLVEEQEKEIKTLGQSKKETAEKIDKADKRITQLAEELKSKEDRIAEFEESLKRLDKVEKKLGRPGWSTGEERKSVGRMFVESDAYKNMIANNQLTSAPMRVKSLFGSFAKKQITSDITDGTLTDYFRFPEIIQAPERALRIRDLLSVRTIGTDSIKYVEETGFTNNAAPVAEGAEKPESNITFKEKTASVEVIAHWIPVSRQVLNDVSQLEGYIDTRLIYGVKLAEENQILYGNGVSPNLNGIMPVASTYSWSSGQAGDTKLDCIRRAMTVARLAEYPVDGIVLHPSDWEDIELLKGSDGKYIWIVVTEGGVPRLFRVPVVDTTAINVGEALTGAFKLGAMLWDREDANVRVAEQHADYFIKNLVLLLGEERVTLTVFRPQAFVNITFDSAPTGS